MRVTTKAEVGLGDFVGLRYGVRRWYSGRESYESVACVGGHGMNQPTDWRKVDRIQ